MKLAPPLPRFWFLAAVAMVAACFGLTAFHAEDDPNDQFVYDRTESVLHLSLEAPGGTVFYAPSLIRVEKRLGKGQG